MRIAEWTYDGAIIISALVVVFLGATEIIPSWHSRILYSIAVVMFGIAAGITLMRMWVRKELEQQIAPWNEVLVEPAVQIDAAQLVIDPYYDDTAAKRALTLFEQLLKPDELAEWRQRGRVRIFLDNGFWADIGSGRVFWSDGYNQCVYPRDGNMPPQDYCVAQLLYLRNDPDKMRKIGGLSPVVRRTVFSKNNPNGTATRYEIKTADVERYPVLAARMQQHGTSSPDATFRRLGGA